MSDDRLKMASSLAEGNQTIDVARLAPEVAQRPIVLATGRVNLDAALSFLRGLLARLSEDDAVVLEAGEHEPRRWTVTVKALLGGDLDEILRDLPADTRLFVDNWSGDRVFALATFGTVEPATFILDLGDRKVSVAVLAEPVKDDRIEDAWISVPGLGGVSIAAESAPVDLDDARVAYSNAVEADEPAEQAGGEPPSGGAVIEGEMSDETAARVVSLATNNSVKAKFGWKNQAATLGEFGSLLLTHEVGEKDGLCILQGELVGDQRNKTAVRACYVMALDLDTGEDLAKIQAAVRELGRCAFVYSTHSSMKEESETKRDPVLAFASGRPIDDALLADFLIQEQGVRPYLAKSVRIVDAARHTKDGIQIVFAHAPWPKYRLFFPLRDPFVFASRGEATSHRAGMTEWKGRLYGLAHVLGVHMDPKCTDPSRLFFLPRHDADRPFTTWALLSDDLLSVDDDVPLIDGREKGPHSIAAEWFLGRDRKIPIENRWLYGWVQRYGKKFEIHEWLRRYAEDWVAGDRPSGEGATTLCPHNEQDGGHTEQTIGGTFCAPGDGERSFVWRCEHAHCADYDKLNFLDIMLTKGLVEQRWLYDPDYLMLEQGEDIPPEWDAGAVLNAVDRICKDYETNKITWSACVAALAPLTAGMESDAVAKLIANLSKLSGVGRPQVKQELAAATETAVVTRQTRERPSWWGELARKQMTLAGETVQTDTPEACSLNVGIFMQHHPLLSGRVMLDRLRTRPRVFKPLPWDNGAHEYPRDWTDADYACLRCWFQALGPDDRLMLEKSDIVDGFLSYIQAHGLDPVYDYLQSLKWDGRPRIDGWLADYAGADDTPLNRALGAKWLISAVARQYDPGCQSKYVLVLESPQDHAKSKALAILGGEWFTDNVKKFDDKDTAMIVQTNWIVELSELSGVKGRAIEEVKAFISRTEDEYRAPYGHFNIKRKRQCVFAGTTNEAKYLYDATGNVRFWPVKLHAHIDTDALRRDRDQIWAEAVSRYLEGENWWFDYGDEADLKLIGDLREAQVDREIEDPLVQKVAFHLDHERPLLDKEGEPVPDWMEIQEKDYVARAEPWQGFTAAEMLEALGVDFKNRRGGEIRIGYILKELGYQHRRDSAGRRLMRYWLPAAQKEKAA